MTRQESLAEIKVRLEAVYANRLREVVLYGSEARGTAGPDSDIDLLVILEGPVHLWDDLRAAVGALYPLSLQLGRPLSPKPVDAQHYKEGLCPLYQVAKKEGIRL